MPLSRREKSSDLSSLATVRSQTMRERTPVMSGKHELRVQMRVLRRGLADQRLRSERVAAHLIAMSQVEEAQRVMVFTSIPGEPEMSEVRSWCDAQGKETAVPEDHVDPSWPDVVVVPGLAFTTAGDRLGQGGGWYDRFLSKIRPNCTTIGVGFDQQIVEALPTEAHDVGLDFVVTDGGMVPAR